ncbi:MAG: S16 family serine protease, partial [bacterium]
PLERIALVGEVGLAGEVRPVVHLERRLEEASRLGFTRCLVPEANRASLASTPPGLKVEGVADLARAVDLALS